MDTLDLPAPPTLRTAVIAYEYPLNERIRTLLRLEDLQRRARYFADGTDPLEHHVALVTVFDMLEITARADLKSELLQELDRQRQSLEALRNNPAIAQDALEACARRHRMCALAHAVGRRERSARNCGRTNG